MTDEDSKPPPRRVLASTAAPLIDPVTMARMAKARNGAERSLEVIITRRLPWWRRALRWLRLTVGLLVPAPRPR